MARGFLRARCEAGALLGARLTHRKAAAGAGGGRGIKRAAAGGGGSRRAGGGSRSRQQGSAGTRWRRRVGGPGGRRRGARSPPAGWRGGARAAPVRGGQARGRAERLAGRRGARGRWHRGAGGQAEPPARERALGRRRSGARSSSAAMSRLCYQCRGCRHRDAVTVAAPPPQLPQLFTFSCDPFCAPGKGVPARVVPGAVQKSHLQTVPACLASLHTREHPRALRGGPKGATA